MTPPPEMVLPASGRTSRRQAAPSRRRVRFFYKKAARGMRPFREGQRICFAYCEDRGQLRAWCRASDVPEGWARELGGAWPGLPVVILTGRHLRSCGEDAGVLAFLKAAYGEYRQTKGGA